MRASSTLARAVPLYGGGWQGALARSGGIVVRAAVIALFAFIVFGPLFNLVLWAFTERWYFPNKLPQA